MLGLVPNPDVGDFRAIYLRAIHYLSQSRFARTIIEDLDGVPERIGIKVVSRGGSEFIPPYARACPDHLNGGLIIWNYTDVVQTTDFAANDPRLMAGEARRANVSWTREIGWGAWFMEGIFGRRTRTGSLSQAMGLLHEMGHAVQWFNDPIGFRHLHTNDLMELENMNVRAIEATVAHELRARGHNETVRWDYGHQGHLPGGNAWPNWLRWVYE